MQMDFDRAARDFFAQHEDVLWRKLGTSENVQYYYCEDGIYVVRVKAGPGKRFEFCFFKAKSVAELLEMYYGKADI